MVDKKFFLSSFPLMNIKTLQLRIYIDRQIIIKIKSTD